MERTLVIFKPDAIQNRICGKVLARFEEAGFEIIECKIMQLSSELLREHYAHIADKPFYPEVEEFMQQTPVIVMVLQSADIIQKMRELLGVTDCLEAAPGTIRAEYGSKEPETSKMRNIVHASDNPETAQKEITRFFG